MQTMPPIARAWTALLLLGVAVQVGVIVGPWPQETVDAPAMQAAYDCVLLGAAVLCGIRVLVRPGERLAWGLIAVALAVYAGGNWYWSLALSELEEAPYPSIADALWLGFYPLAYAAIVLLARSRMPRLGFRLWLDGLIAALTVGAIGAAVVFKAVRASTGGDAAAIATNLAYPLADMLLFGLAAGVMAAGRRRLDRTWVVLGLGLGVFAVSDAVYLFQVANETYATGTLLDIGWLAGALVVGLAAWQPSRAQAPADDVPSIVLPVGLSLASLTLLVQDHGSSTESLAVVLATAAMLAVIARLAVTHRQSRDHLTVSRHQARTDSLTGLGNRLKLLHDLELLRADDEQRTPHLLLLFDLDGFKHYNDSYGHPAGDALLRQLGHQLSTAADGRGLAYRMGGDEFCVLAPWDGDPEPLIALARAALCADGDGFRIGASCGYARIPDEGLAASDALRVADRRLYAEKNSGRISALAQSKTVLLRAVGEWDAELEARGVVVSALAADVARELGLDEETVERVATAAELHDIGKIAIPRPLLLKPGALDADEWEFIRRHTLIGERIVSGAPALVGVSRLIRSSHERWDGCGYPDALAGDEIPLGSQIVFVCDAFAAMTSERSYQPALSEAVALAELRRNAGSQFAPAVVEAFLAVRDRQLVT